MIVPKHLGQYAWNGPSLATALRSCAGLLWVVSEF